MFSAQISPSHVAADDSPIITCPNCGGGDYEDNRIDDALHRETAREAPRLRYEGRADEVIEMLTALYAIRIVNFLRPEWRCLSCEVTFDA